MEKITTIGLDLAKNVFQAHGADADGAPVLRRKLWRAEVLTFFEKLPACLVGMEACGGSHYWAREIEALGHEVRLIPPAYVKPYIKRGKTDAADAEGICEAVVRQESQLINALRAHMYELGIITGKGVSKVSTLISIIRDPEDGRVPPVTRFALVALVNQFEAMVKRDLDMQRLATIPGVGPITAASIKALVPDISGFKSARHFAAWLGLTPKPHSSGGKERLGGISKMGNPTLRRLLVLGAISLLRRAKNAEVAPRWIAGLLARRPAKVVAVAMANKTARIAYALLTKGEVYQKSPVNAA